MNYSTVLNYVAQGRMTSVHGLQYQLIDNTAYGLDDCIPSH
jgi:hypothetical protein